MTRKRPLARRPRTDVQELRARLQAAEEALRALQAGDVDALMVERPTGPHVVTLAGADLPYRILLDQMNEGAVTLTRDGVIAYCNQRFAAIVRTPLARVIGAPIDQFVPPAERAPFEDLRRRAGTENARGEMFLRAGDGSPVPVAVSFAPLRAEGSADVIGAVGVIRDITDRRRADEQRARLVEQVITAQDEERRRIARELHDETGQSLTAVLVGLRTIEGSPTLPKAVELASRLRETTAQTLIDVGRLWRGLHPAVLDDLGIGAVVARQVREFAQLHGVAVDVQAKGLVGAPLPPLLLTTLYRVLQEALTNVARHARARNVSVRLVRDDGTMELRIRDDGIGFGADGDGGGLGLQGMRERAALLGGSVEVESRAGKGTTLTAHFPVRSE